MMMMMIFAHRILFFSHHLSVMLVLKIVRLIVAFPTDLVLIDQSEHHTEKICTLKVKNLSGLGLRMVTGSEDKVISTIRQKKVEQ
jgi:hypothetical protein